jgi:hypothetical protein
MLTQSYVKDYANDKPRMFEELAKMSAGNPTLARIWRNNYSRVTVRS